MGVSTASDPFQILKNIQMVTSGAGSEEFRSTLASLYLLAIVIATIGLAVSLVLCGLKLASAKNGAARDEAKKELMWKGVLGVFIFGFTAFLGIAFDIAASFKV